MNPNPAGGFSVYSTSTHPSQQQTVQQQQYAQEQARLREQILVQQQAALQYQAQQIQSHYMQYQNGQQYVAAPVQQDPQTAALYQQQMNVQARLAHLHLQHPQQAQRNDRRTPSPTRQAPLPSPNSLNPRVTINRSTAGFSKNTLDTAESAKIKLEHLYKVSVEQAVERNQRYIRILSHFVLIDTDALTLKLDWLRNMAQRNGRTDSWFRLGGKSPHFYVSDAQDWD
jgi:hypothetical protein